MHDEPRRHLAAPVRQRVVTFFERQFETLQSVPQAADADLDLAFSRKPYLKFLKCRIRNDRHPCAKCLVVPGELSLASGTPRQRLRLTSRPSTTKRLVM